MFYLYVFSSFLLFSLSLFSIHFILDDALALGLSEVYPCRKCNRIYARKYTRSRHERLECGIEAQFECSFCNFRAKHKHNLKSHISKAHSKRLVEYRTIICIHSFSIHWSCVFFFVSISHCSSRKYEVA